MATGWVSSRRADTRRNHERILTVAAESLARSGAVSFNAIAKKAEVGVGTVYRHFPTQEALILAVYKRDLRQLVEVVPRLLEAYSPEQAFRAWATDHLAHYMMTRRGLIEAIRAAIAAPDMLLMDPYAAMSEAVATLVEANVVAGTVHADLDPETVLCGLGGVMYLHPNRDWRGHTERLTDLLWRGMRRDGDTVGSGP